MCCEEEAPGRGSPAESDKAKPAITPMALLLLMDLFAVPLHRLSVMLGFLVVETLCVERVASFLRFNSEKNCPFSALYQDKDRVGGLEIPRSCFKVFHRTNDFAIDFDEDVAWPKACAVAWRIGFYLCDHNPMAIGGLSGFDGFDRQSG